jgi:hypothetical protein
MHARVISILKQGRIRHSPHRIDPLVCWARLGNCLRRSCLPGS